MEISALVDSISSFLNLSSSRHIDLDPFDKYYKRVQELLKPMAVATVLNSDLVLEEKLCKSFQELTQDVDHSRDLFTSWHPFSSKVYFVLQIESLIPKMPDTIVDTFQFLKSSKHDLPDELSPASLQKCLEKIKHLSYEEISSVIDGALRDHREAVGPTPEILVKIGENTGLRSNQEILIEAVALERQKEIAEQSENNAVGVELYSSPYIYICKLTLLLYLVQ
ncbi:unnamed protein product [Brassica oleracea]